MAWQDWSDEQDPSGQCENNLGRFAVVQVRHDKGLSEGSGDGGKNEQIKKVLSRKSLQASKTDWVANFL